MVVNFAIKCNDNFSIFIIHRLAAVIEVDNRKTSKAHIRFPVNMLSGTVRTAVNNFIHHICENFFTVFKIPGEPCKSTHIHSSLF